MFVTPASTCINVRRCKHNKTTSAIIYSPKTEDEKLWKTSLMKCQSQLASLQLIHKSWWQSRLPSLLNWQVPKEAHLPGITPPFLFAFFRYVEEPQRKQVSAHLFPSEGFQYTTQS